MTIKSTNACVSRTLIESTMFEIEKYLMKEYGTWQTAQDMSPLEWYVWTGRASAEFLSKMIFAVKPYTIARRLHEGGTYDEVINRVKKLLEVAA